MKVGMSFGGWEMTSHEKGEFTLKFKTPIRGCLGRSMGKSSKSCQWITTRPPLWPVLPSCNYGRRDRLHWGQNKHPLCVRVFCRTWRQILSPWCVLQSGWINCWWIESWTVWIWPVTVEYLYRSKLTTLCMLDPTESNQCVGVFHVLQKKQT